MNKTQITASIDQGVHEWLMIESSDRCSMSSMVNQGLRELRSNKWKPSPDYTVNGVAIETGTTPFKVNALLMRGLTLKEAREELLKK